MCFTSSVTCSYWTRWRQHKHAAVLATETVSKTGMLPVGGKTKSTDRVPALLR
jgi:hypothetical protein